MRGKNHMYSIKTIKGKTNPELKLVSLGFLPHSAIYLHRVSGPDFLTCEMVTLDLRS